MARTAVDILINATDRASSVIQNVGRQFDGLKGSMQRAEAGSKALLAGVAAAGVASTMAFTSFDDSMRKVEATMGGKLGNTVKEVTANTERLRDKAKEMGATTAFSATDAANAMEKLALAGWDTEQVIAGIEPSLNLASAAGLDLATSADILTDTMAAFKLGANEASKSADIFAATSSSTNTDVNQLGEAMKYAGAAAGAASQSLSDTSATLGFFANVGIKGSMAGTTFVSMLRDMKKNAKDGAIQIGKTSVALYDSQGNMRSVIDIMGDVEKATSGMSDKQRDAALAGTFQVESMKGVNAILAQGSGNLRKLATDLDNSNGRAAEMAAHMEGGLGGAFRSAWSAISAVAIELGEKLAPALEAVIRVGATVFSQIASWISNSNSFYAVLVIVGGAILGGVVPALYAMATAAWAAMSPLIPFVAAGAAVAAVALLIYQNWSTISSFFQSTFGGLWATFTAFFGQLLAYVQPALQAVWTFIQQKLAELQAFWNENWSTIKQALQNVWTAISTVIQTALNIIMTIFNTVWPAISFIVQSVWENIKGLISGALDIIMGVIKIFASLFTGDWQGLWEGIKQLLSGALQFIWNYVQLFLGGKVIGIIGKFAGKAIQFFAKLASQAGSKVSGLVSKVVSFFTNMVSRVVSTISSWVSNIVSRVTSLVSQFTGKITGLSSRVLSLFKSMFTKAVSSVASGVKSMVSKVTGFVGQFLKAGKGLLDAFVKGIKSGIDKAKGAVEKGMGAIRNLLPFSPAKEGPLSDLDKSGESFFPTWYEGALKKVPKMSREIGSAMGQLNKELTSEGGVELEAFSGGRARMTIVHEHRGTVEVEGDNSSESVDFTANSIRNETEITAMNDLRRIVRSY
ncbi:tail length tape-measure protein T [Bacillus phage PK1]